MKLPCRPLAAKLIAAAILSRRGRRGGLPTRRGLLALLLLLPAVVHAQTAGPPAAPILQIEIGTHTATIRRISVDAANRYLVTASDDKTLRVWDAATGAPLAVLRPPLGDGDEGKMYAVALSPDGNVIACGGWTSPGDAKENLYLFDRASGHLTRRLTGLPNVINHLAFSPDGLLLAAALATGGVRLWRTADWSPAGQDPGYGAEGYGITFSPDGAKLAASSYDGSVRLYAVTGDGSLSLTAKSQVAGGTRPYGLAFSPDGARLAVGFYDTPRVAVVSAADLSPLYAPKTAGMDSDGSLSSITWSADGQSLYAAGRCQKRYEDGWHCVVRRWANGGRGAATDLPAASTVSDLLPRKAGGVFFGTADPAFGALDGAGKRAFFQGPATADFRYSGGSRSTFRISRDGGTVQLEYQDYGKQLATFALAARALAPGTGAPGLAAPVTSVPGLSVLGWENTTAPSLNGKTLKLQQYEYSQSLALAPDHHSLLVGTEWNLYCFARSGTQRWIVPAPGVAWAVNVSGDGRLAVAAFSDGTVRWYRMTDGQELLALFPHADAKRWVLWTPTGYYDCSPGGEDLIGWHVNHGADQAADFFPASRFRDAFYRPDVVAKVLTTLDEKTALAQADAEAGRRQTPTADVKATLPPVVTILSPQSGDAVSGDAVTVRYSLRTPSGEPATEVRALVDGRPVQTESGLSVVSTDGVTRTVSVPLPPRDCLVSVLAFNRFTASEPATVPIRRQAAAKGTEIVTPSPTTEFVIQPKLYVLAVGISRYQDAGLHLTYPDKDAQDFVAAMQGQKGRLYRDVQVYGGKALTDADATKDAIEDGLDWIQKQTTSNDVAMIFLSGHGSNDSNGKYFFLPADFDRDHIKSTGLPWTDIVSTVQDIAGKVILFNDSCHSGNVLGGTLKGLPPDNTGIINELTSAENGAVVFAAATGSEYALEKPDWNNGAFTKALVEGIGGQADYGHTGRITVNMLSLYVSERVKTLTDGQQHPTANKPATVRDFPLAAAAVP